MATIGEDTISDFEASGSQKLVQALLSVEKDARYALAADIFTELLIVYLEGSINLELLVQFLSQVVRDEQTAQLFCQLVDVFPVSELITALLADLYKRQNIIKVTTIGRYISPDTLGMPEIGVVSNGGANLTRQLNISKRDAFYTQKKFNLLHELVEGYSRLITEFNTILTGQDLLQFQTRYALKVTNLLIGHYSLDPNKVLDVLLECFVNQVVGNHPFIFEFLKSSQWWPHQPADNLGLLSLSTGGNETAAKFFGLRILKSDRDLAETTKILLALLISIGFISFGLIYKYLDPQNISDLENEYKKSLEDQVFKASASALAMAAPLADDDPEESLGKDKADGGKESKSNGLQLAPLTIDQKLEKNHIYQYLKVFLSIGLYWPSIYILTEYPFLANIGEVPFLMNRVIDGAISSWHGSLVYPVIPELSSCKLVASSRPQNSVSYGPVNTTRNYCFKASIRSNGSKSFEFFYPDWVKGIPQVSLKDQLIQFAWEFLRFSGTNLASDLVVFTKLCQIASHELNHISLNDLSKAEENDIWFKFFRNYIFMAVPLIEENSFAVDAAWEVLKYFLVEERYNLYGELQNVLAKNNPYIKIAAGKAERATKGVLKRLLKENVDVMMRRLAKISFSNPLPCFLTVFQQLESYDNLNLLVVQTARYFNSYGWDVLVLAILMRLTTLGRSVFQQDGLNDRKWIQLLSSFIGKICQKYPNNIDLSTLFSFLIKSLHQKETIALNVVKEIFISMGGVQPITNLTLRQISMINSQSSLRKFVYKTIDDVRYEREKSGTVLIDTLVNLNVVNELFVLLCNLSDSVITEDYPLKVIGSRIDEVNTIIHLFTENLATFGLNKSLNILEVQELQTKYNVTPEWGYQLYRSLKKTAIVSTSSLYDLFWMHQLYDITYSSELYDDQLIKFKANIESLRSTIQMNSRNKEIPKSVVETQQKELLQIRQFVANIPREKEVHSNHVATVLEAFSSSLSQWFSDAEFGMSDFLSKCILPRSIHSPFDAAYASEFIFLIQGLELPGFDIALLIDSLIQEKLVFATLFSCTGSEAENYGLFFASLLTKLHKFLTSQEGSFQKRVYQYHCNILTDISELLKTSEYMSRRNAITFLKNLLGVYPVVDGQSEQLLELIQNVSSKDERGDLKLALNALIGHMKFRLKDCIPVWEFVEFPEEEKNVIISERKKVLSERKAIEDKRKLLEERRREKEAEERRIKEEQAKKVLEAKKRQEAEEAEKKRLVEESKKLEEEKKLAEKRAIEGVSKYDDNNNSGTATSARNGTGRSNSGESNRYDYYSKFDDSTQQTNKRPLGPSEKNSGSGLKAGSLKEKLKEAKREYQKNKDINPRDYNDRERDYRDSKPRNDRFDTRSDSRSDARNDSKNDSKSDSKNDSRDSRNDRNDSRGRNDRNDGKDSRYNRNDQRDRDSRSRNAPRDRNDSRSNSRYPGNDRDKERNTRLLKEPPKGPLDKSDQKRQALPPQELLRIPDNSSLRSAYNRSAPLPPPNSRPPPPPPPPLNPRGQGRVPDRRDERKGRDRDRDDWGDRSYKRQRR